MADKSRRSGDFRTARPPSDGRFVFFFDRGSARLRKRETPKLRTLARLMRRSPDILLLIHGHTVGRGTNAYNAELGRSRARTIARALQQLGIGQARIITLSDARRRTYGHLPPLERHRRRRADTSVVRGTPAERHLPPLLAETGRRQAFRQPRLASNR